MLCAMTSEPVPPQKLRLASYNVRKAVGLDRRRDPSRVLDVIAELDADVVALQEADLRLGDRPSAFDPIEIAERTGLMPLPVSEADRSLGWHGNAILVREGVTIQDAHRLQLPGLEPRGAVITELETTAGGLTLVATHLGLLRSNRRKQASLLRSVLGKQAGGRVAILGDFNEWRTTGGLNPLQAHFEIHAPGHSFHAARPFAALDRIALSPGLELRDAGVHRSRLARRASDHLPIWADVILKDPKREG